MKKASILALSYLASSAAFAPAVFAAGNGIGLGLQELLPVHIALMSLSGAALIVGSLLAKYGKGKIAQWLKWHKTLQVSAGFLGLLGIVAAIIMVEDATGAHLRVAHSIVAVVSLGLIVLSITVAFGFLKGKKYKKELRVAHRWLGRITTTAWIATILLGLFTPLAGIF